NVPEETMKKAGKFLDSVQAKFKYDGKDKEGNAESRDGVGYGYTGPQQTPTMTAVGLLCRQYLGWSPRKVELVNGVNWMRDTYPPGTAGSMYYYYYATQVMHHMQGESWATWNPKMRDLLVAKQDKGQTKNRSAQYGSWGPDGDAHGGAGGRIMVTSLSLLTLEVYYRH